MSRDAGQPDFPFRYYGHSEWLRQGVAAKVEPLDEILASEGLADKFGNVEAEEGVDRCPCGAKYWEHDRCVSCGARFQATTHEPTKGAPTR